MVKPYKPRFWYYNEAGRLTETDSVLVWGKYFQFADRHILKTSLPDGYRVSTVFLGLDHNYSDDGPPVLWETMVFHPDDVYMDRYTSQRAAWWGHWKAVLWVLWDARHLILQHQRK